MAARRYIWEVQELASELVIARIRAHMATGKMLEELDEFTPTNKATNAPRTNRLYMWLGVATPTGGTTLSVKRDLPIRLAVQVVAANPEAGQRLSMILAGRATHALTTDPASMEINTTLEAAPGHALYPESVNLRHGPFEPPYERQDIRQGMYECRSTVVGMITHNL